MQISRNDWKFIQRLFNAGCDFDGGDCSLGVTGPWANCTASLRCWELFKNNECNEECNTPECLFDGYDCGREVKPCNPIYDAYCQTHYANGHCDYGCNTAECNWDGLDCENEPPVLAMGTVSLVLEMDLPTFKNQSVAFVRYMGRELRTTVRIKTDPQGNEMVYPWNPTDDPSKAFGSGYSYLYPGLGARGVIVYLEIDNRKCIQSTSEECFSRASQVAQYLGASASTHVLGADFHIARVLGLDAGPPDFGPGTDSTFAKMTYVIVGALCILVVALVVGVLVTTRRKQARGITWFPEGFLRNNSGQRRTSRRRGPDGQEMRNLHKQPSTNRLDIDHTMVLPGDMNGHYGNEHANDHSRWSDDEDSMDRPPMKRNRSSEGGYSSDQTAMTEYDENDPRPWTQQHLDAADVRPDLNGLAFTPPVNQLGSPDPAAGEVDVRGPYGFTPLMIASYRGNGLDTGEDDEEDGSAAIIQDLLMQGAKPNATMDKTGETSLHLAARYARADAAKRLLEAGADANAQDNTGRSPLHAAVASDAQGVFQILLRNRATNLNSRMHDGTTPLILAARLAIEGMVEDLINADVDINAADEQGKTALHWAAAVNNIDAVNILLSHGANKDAQDNKDETPLFLAAREGSFEAVRSLLDHHANRDIPDHMDRLPRDVAQERLHNDIVRLLDEHIPRSNHHVMPMSSSQTLPTSANQHNAMAAESGANVGTTGRPPKPKKRPKSTVAASRENQRHLGSSMANLDDIPAGSSTALVSAGANQGTKRRAANSSRKKKNDNAGSTNTVQSADSVSTMSLTLSPANSHSLESPPTVDLGATPSPYNVMSYGSHPHMTSGSAPQPPPYDECIKTAASMQAIHMSNMDPSYGYVHYDYRNHMQPQQQQQQASIHQRQTSLPASTVSSSLGSSLQQQQAMSYNALAVNTAYQSTLSPPQFALSPPASYAGSPPQQQVQTGVTSPTKSGSRPSLPTSPTHIAAMQRAAAQQRTTGFEFPETMMSYRTGGMQQQNQYHYQQHYPTPPHSHLEPSPSQHVLHPPEAYLTPSPESPGQWSSASPHSTSDWSEGMSSPPNPQNMSYVPPGSHAKHTEGIYI